MALCDRCQQSLLPPRPTYNEEYGCDIVYENTRWIEEGMDAAIKAAISPAELKAVRSLYNKSIKNKRKIKNVFKSKRFKK